MQIHWEVLYLFDSNDHWTSGYSIYLVTHKSISTKTQYQKPTQTNSKGLAKGFKSTTPPVRKHSNSKQTPLTASPSTREKQADAFYDENEETPLLGKIIFNLELDKQEEQGNKDDFDDESMSYKNSKSKTSNHIFS